jgi:hypothetical protein
MQITFIRRTFAALVGVCALFGTGCGGGPAQTGVTVTGKIIFPHDVKIEDQDGIQISFVKDQGTGAAGAQVGKEKTFSATNVPPGTYKITVQFQPYAGMPDNEKRAPAIKSLNDKYGTTKSKLNCEVTTQPEQSITVDLDKGTVTKG